MPTSTLFWKFVFLALVQGVSEIFPISSSSHLVIFSRLLQVPVTYDVLIFFHVGTFLAILLYYRQEVWKILSLREGWRFPAKAAVSLALTTLVGFAMKALIGMYKLEGADTAACLLILNGTLVIIFGSAAPQGERKMTDLRLWEFILVGAAQGITALPGISRLGMTLGILLLFGLTWFDALKLSFLVSLPTIFFANLYMVLLSPGGFPTLPDLASGNPPGQIISLVMILLLTFAAGWVSLKLLSRYFGKRLLVYFGIYNFMAGIFFVFLLKLF